MNFIKLIVLRISPRIHPKPDKPILKDIASAYKYAEGSGKQKRSISVEFRAEMLLFENGNS